MWLLMDIYYMPFWLCDIWLDYMIIISAMWVSMTNHACVVMDYDDCIVIVTCYVDFMLLLCDLL